MLDLKIKTMDGQTHSFSVPENITIENLKERTASTLNIPAGSQRVIYQGRVLQNDYKLSQSHHEKTLHVVNHPAPSTNNPPNSQSANRTSSNQSTNRNSNNQTTNTTPTNRPSGHMMRINIGSSGNGNDLNSFFQDTIGRAISGALNQGSGVQIPQPTIVELNMDDIQVEMDRTAPQVSGSSVRSQQRTTNHFCPRAMDNLWTHLSDLERLLDSEQVPARREPEGTGGAGGENVNSNTMPAEGVPAVEVDEAESNSSVEFTAPVPLHHSQRSLNLSNTDLAGPENGSTSQTNSANNTRDRTRTVMVSEFHEFMSRFTRAQPRINRMMERATEFFARDPSFQSTTGEDYIEQERFMQDFQQVNRLAGMIHRGVSIAQVPLSQIPPRALMAQTRQDSVPNVSGLPLGGLASAGRNSRRNETPTAGGRGRIHVRSSTPSSRSASTNFSLPSNITLNARINPRIHITRTNVPSGNLPIGVRVVTNRVVAPHSNQSAATGNNLQQNQSLPRVNVSRATGNNQQNQNLPRVNVSVNTAPSPSAGGANVQAPRTARPIDTLQNAVNNALNANNGIGTELMRVLNSALSSNISNTIAQTLANNPVNPAQEGQNAQNQHRSRQTRPSAPTNQRQNARPQAPQAQQQNVQPQGRGGPQIEDSDVNDFNGLSAETVAELTSTTKISPPLKCLKDPAVAEARGANGERSLGEIMMILYEKAISRGFTDTRLKLVDFLNDYDFPNFPSSHDNSDWNVMEKALIMLVNTMQLYHVGALLAEGKLVIPQDWIIKFRHFFSTNLFDGCYITNKPRMIQKLRNHYPKIREWLRMFFATSASSPPHIDLVESNFNMITNFLEELFTILFCGDTGMPCELGINYLVPRFFKAFLALNIEHVDGGIESFVQYIHEYLTNKHGVRGGPIFELGLNHLLTSMADWRQQTEYAKKFLHKRGHQPQHTASKPESLSSTSKTSTTSSLSAQKRKSVSPDNNKPSTSECKEINEDDWRKLVPRGWVANIERDVVKQQKMPKYKQFSQAYKIGMSEKM